MKLTKDQIRVLKPDCRALGTQIYRSKVQFTFPFADKNEEKEFDELVVMGHKLNEKIKKVTGEYPVNDPVNYFAIASLPTEHGIQGLFNYDNY